jgi:hypothetical protein
VESQNYTNIILLQVCKPEQRGEQSLPLKMRKKTFVRQYLGNGKDSTIFYGQPLLRNHGFLMKIDLSMPLFA